VGLFEGKHRVATVSLSGSERSIRVLHTNADPEVALFGPPAWSPDGKQLLFGASSPAGDAEVLWWNSYVYSMPADGSEPPVLLEGKKIGRMNRGMNWSRDGTKIIFSSDR
jgi:Tol biopolymer transport system component